MSADLLCFWVKHNHYRCSQFYLKRFQPVIRKEIAHYLIFTACRYGHLETLIVLQQYLPDFNLHVAPHIGLLLSRPNIMNLLLFLCDICQVKVDNDYLLYLACYSGNLEVVSYFKKVCRLNPERYDCLALARQLNRVDIIEVLS
jgi:hypothetical protein